MSRSKPNFLILLTDQERATQHFPPGWSERNQLNLNRLKRHGLTFNRAFCNTCMCSPSRSTLFTSLYPAQHRVTDTLTWDGTFSPTETVLDPTIPNLATLLRPQGYRTPYRGKWHLSKGGSGEASLINADVAIYGFEGWVPPDAGEDIKVVNFGGGYADHDSRYVAEAAAYLRRAAESPGQEPFCLVLSLVNPHDLLSYPKTWQYGYTQRDLDGPVELPPTWDEDLRAAGKPTAQAQLVDTAAVSLGPLPTRQDKHHYVNFYANLIRQIDQQLTPIVDLLYHPDGAPTDLGRSTVVVRTADHGEMGLAHGGMRQKAFNFYEESARVPLVFSNPVLFPEPRETDRLASLIDVLPTVLELAGAPAPQTLSGKSLAPLLADSQTAVQSDITFTFDDIRASAADRKEVVAAANRIRAIREERWKYARYFHAEGSYPAEYEMYDLLADPEERDNLAHPGNPRHGDPEVARERERLAALLTQKELEILVRESPRTP